MDIVDIKTYMQAVGREARAASRMMARVETASKNQALTAIAAAIRRNEKKLLAAKRSRDSIQP
jgi:glutamate-5-semialdehyde dehydrogenase